MEEEEEEQGDEEDIGEANETETRGMLLVAVVSVVADEEDEVELLEIAVSCCQLDMSCDQISIDQAMILAF